MSPVEHKQHPQTQTASARCDPSVIPKSGIVEDVRGCGMEYHKREHLCAYEYDSGAFECGVYAARNKLGRRAWRIHRHDTCKGSQSMASRF